MKNRIKQIGKEIRTLKIETKIAQRKDLYEGAEKQQELCFLCRDARYMHIAYSLNKRKFNLERIEPLNKIQLQTLIEELGIERHNSVHLRFNWKHDVIEYLEQLVQKVEENAC